MPLKKPWRNGNHLFFSKTIVPFSPLKIRLGGTLQDRVIYQTENKKEPCLQFAVNSSYLFGYTAACLPLARWDELNTLFNKSGALVIFGLNALNGKTVQSDGLATGPWGSSNAASLIRHTIKKGYNIYVWELGNELCGGGIGARILAHSYANDTIMLDDLIRDIYEGTKIKPHTISPGLNLTGLNNFFNKTIGHVNYVTHHIYNLGPGKDDKVLDRVQDPSVLDNVIDMLSNPKSVIKSSGSSALAWVGEAGGAYNSGRNGVTNAFVFSFWYLDQLGLAATYDTMTYCRQTLIGGNYCLLNTTTFIPNPGYYRLVETGGTFVIYSVLGNVPSSVPRRFVSPLLWESGSVHHWTVIKPGSNALVPSTNLTAEAERPLIKFGRPDKQFLKVSWKPNPATCPG